ncbi:uncharacterized protein DFL_004506 [Arthrobotrys flagrans]|uniref:C2H2-type domain-containing protein n=1 Tax=Arthrobotrys flagrans TaxID=97331 RepID=A0A437A502_ARTFL|nr:hypothetical protein DFL_004506 [Arthrobotrys flagrans]
MATGMCKNCLKGFIHEGETKGHITSIHGFETYVSHPSSPGSKPAILVLIPDAMGWASPNVRLTADRFAARTGCTVYLPDFMAGYQMPLWVMDLPIENMLHNWTSPMSLLLKPYYFFWALYVVIPFRLTNNLPKSHPRVVKFFTELRKNEGKENLVGVAGFCWGGKHAFLLGAEKADGEDGGEYLIDFAYAGHPSRIEIPKEIDELQTPMSVAMGTEDYMNPMEFSNQMKEMLEKKGGRAVGSELVFYEGGNHGFACRADLKNERLKECADAAEDHFVRWVGRMVERLGVGRSTS